MTDPYPYYVIWTGSLHLGDTPGVFMDAQYCGLIVQIPVIISFSPVGTNPISFVFTTTDVEIFDNKKHPIYWDWVPGTNLPTPVGYINDENLITGQPERHFLSIPHDSAAIGKHWLTIQVNSETGAGLRDDFVLKRLEVQESFGAKIGW